MQGMREDLGGQWKPAQTRLLLLKNQKEDTGGTECEAGGGKRREKEGRRQLSLFDGPYVIISDYSLFGM